MLWKGGGVTIVPPAPGEPRRPAGPRDPGDAWVVAETGERYWGRFGAAGVLVVDAERGILLQHRVGWSHFGGTWGIPGGALHENESAIVGALREASEEAGIPDGAVRPRFTSVLDLQIWSYTTVVADVSQTFEPVISDPESIALEWVPIAEVAERPLHPGFAGAWAQLEELLTARPALVVDAANVVGSVPDGWWRDRAGAAGRLHETLTGLEVPASDLGLPGDIWFPEVIFVVEGQARSFTPDDGGVRVVRAPASGDDAIHAEAERLVADGRAVTVVSSDRGLRARVEAAGARVQSAGWLRGLSAPSR